YLAAARVRGESALARTRSEVGHDEWYRMASGRGVLVLHELRKVVGDKSFAELMESFGKEHAGKEVTIAQFQAHVEKASGKKVDDLLDYWTGQTGLPILRLGEVQVTSMKQEGETRYKVKGEIGRNGGNGKSFPPTLVVEVTV